MRIISWFAMVCFLLDETYSVFVVPGYGRTVVYTPSCVSFRAMKNGRRKADLPPWRSDIRSVTGQFSRPMTGHTPQKLPALAAISCIIAVRA